ncbi:hypothetical protein TGRH88_001080 [Toxoplasma gondii]|uniref:Uncharacterized protein n=1 Tax=Toxoplasma gondii TaxID=5811 RepID=A0A7J6KFN2_TOXGO|nr:hypothetical protein TGRH88_001080 [Toxoplasma gondii]
MLGRSLNAHCVKRVCLCANAPPAIGRFCSVLGLLLVIREIARWRNSNSLDPFRLSSRFILLVDLGVCVCPPHTPASSTEAADTHFASFY